jgi:acetolactate synthase-1/2/3 large subunit
MNPSLSRRDVLKAAAIGCVAALPAVNQQAEAGLIRHRPNDGTISGEMTGAQALVEALILEQTECVFGIPGAQSNELWDCFKAKGLEYLLVTHEFSASAMADGYARSKGKPGVLCVVPGPGLTNSLSGVAEALLDSVPLVYLVGDVDIRPTAKPFQVHQLPPVVLLQQVTKAVYPIQNVAEIPGTVRQAFSLSQSGEPGPVAVVIPFPLLIASHHFNSPPPHGPVLAYDEQAMAQAIDLLSNRKLRVGIYAGLGCMNYSAGLAEAAEILQAPVATSVSGKSSISDNHPLAVGWGYGPQGTRTAEAIFKDVDLVLAVGVRYSEVSTGYYSIPKHRYLIQVDANADNLGRVVKPTVCVNADAGLFFASVLQSRDSLQRPCNPKLPAHIAELKKEEDKKNNQKYAGCGIDPMLFILALRRCLQPDALCFVDVTQSEHWAAEAFSTWQPRTYFNPTNNQSMGWSLPASLGAQKVNPGRQVVTITGDGCFLMSAMELSTAARAHLPVKFFVLDDQAYHYMQSLQKPAYLRTTATILAKLDYESLAKGLGLAYREIRSGDDLDASINGSLCENGPVLTRLIVDYGKRPVRWIDAVHKRYTDGLSTEQKIRFLARIGARAVHFHKEND